MTTEEIREAITSREYLNEEMTMFKEHLDIEKLCAFLAKTLNV
jgi:hypothetical protein